MIDYGKQRSTVKPDELELTETKVFVSSNITEVNEPETDEYSGFTGYEFDLIEYRKTNISKFKQKRMQRWKMKLHRHRWQCVKFMK